jgi:hypothetical protein
VQPAFQVGEQDCDCFDALFVGEVLQALLLNLVDGSVGFTLFFRFQV